MKFITKTTVHWESEDGRYLIKESTPGPGYCAQDTYSDWIEGFGYSRFVFTETLDEAMLWCLND